MRTSQRSLIVASLVVLATAMAGYCLDYQTHEACRRGDRLLENPPPYLFPRVPLVASPILIKLGEAFEQSDSSGSVSCGTVSGVYPRGSITSNAAAIGGFLVPFLLLVGATYVTLGTSRARTAGGVSVQAKVEAPGSPLPPLRPGTPSRVRETSYS